MGLVLSAAFADRYQVQQRHGAPGAVLPRAGLFREKGGEQVSLEIDRIYCGDCLDLMKEMPDKSVDLVLTDPPYGIGVTDNRTVGGGNYYADLLDRSSCWLVWDKDNSGNFADCELAWTSFKTAVRKFKWRWNGMLQEDMRHKEERIHPTQKPVPLFIQILEKYSKPGDLVIDPFLGSGTTAIAYLRTGRHFIGIEKHEPYFIKAQERIDKERQQVRLIPCFDFEEATS